MIDPTNHNIQGSLGKSGKGSGGLARSPYAGDSQSEVRARHLSMEHSRAIRISLHCLQEVIRCSVFHDSKYR